MTDTNIQPQEGPNKNETDKEHKIRKGPNAISDQKRTQHNRESFSRLKNGEMKKKIKRRNVA